MPVIASVCKGIKRNKGEGNTELFSDGDCICTEIKESELVGQFALNSGEKMIE